LNEKSSHAPSPPTGIVRLRNISVGALFAAVLVLPKLLHIRRDERSWTIFRIALGIAGASLVILPLSLWNSWLAALTGLVMFMLAILVPASQPELNLDEKARELGALVVVNGGHYQPGNAPVSAVRLFTGSENIWALDSHLQPLVVIPVSQISLLRAEKIGPYWVLLVRWLDHAAEFSYRGIFAEHFARVAESTIRGVMRPALPVLPRSRAANA
jgi:hypothetical protein